MKYKKISSVLLLCLSVSMIGVGIYQNQPDSVLSKAIRICLECVGIG